jgi:hypothetical protein
MRFQCPFLDASMLMAMSANSLKRSNWCNSPLPVTPQFPDLHFNEVLVRFLHYVRPDPAEAKVTQPAQSQSAAVQGKKKALTLGERFAVGDSYLPAPTRSSTKGHLALAQ